MIAHHAWAAFGAGQPLRAHTIEPGELRDFEVEIEVSHCGVCGSDVHLVDDDWGGTSFPLVPGHEIIGEVRAAGRLVRGLELGARVGVGWQCGACGLCRHCSSGADNLCREQHNTCIGRPGGFADRVRVDHRFAHPIPPTLRSDHAAPLLCAGATVFAPLRRLAGPQTRVGVIGLGGLGHLAVRFARVFGAEVTVFTRGATNKYALARELGATRVVDSGDRDALRSERDQLDLILSTVSADLDWRAYVRALAPGGVLCFLGVPSSPASIPAGLLVDGQRSVTGSVVASRAVTREMLDVAARHQVLPMIECMAMDEVNEALERVRSGAARFRVVLVR